MLSIISKRVRLLILVGDACLGGMGGASANLLIVWYVFPDVITQASWPQLCKYLLASGLVSAGFYVRKPGHGHLSLPGNGLET